MLHLYRACHCGIPRYTFCCAVLVLVLDRCCHDLWSLFLFFAVMLPIDWLQVGQSFSSAVGQSEPIPPPSEKCAGTSAETATGSGRRFKAADFFRDDGTDVEANDNNDKTELSRDTIERHHKRGTKDTQIRKISLTLKYCCGTDIYTRQY